MNIRERLSPNHNQRQAPVDMLILHYTGMASAAAALDRLCDAQAQVSAHYVIEEDGTVWRLVPEEARAWHAGVSCWAGRRDINSHSIGIELVNPGHDLGYRPFPEAQMAALESLGQGILGRHAIPPRHVLGHSDVAPQRKIDPGELFDWPRLARAGIGFFPEFMVNFAENLPDIARIQSDLARIGYEVPRNGTLDPPTTTVIAAFQRHFRPSLCDGTPDAETGARIARVASGI
jgi:N-acetylmuramoyl-L-alanine amidase